MRVALYGGSFNPPHMGHMATALHAAETADVEGVYLAPVYLHPHGKKLEAFGDRVSMCSAMAFSLENVKVTRIEEVTAGRLGRCLTADTLEVFREWLALTPRDVVVLVMGSDLRGEVERWEGYDRLKAEVDAGRLEFFFAERAGDLSSTRVRSAIADGEPYRRMVPRRVHEYVELHGLYKCP